MRRYLLLGTTGVGKSSYINAAFGVHVAATDPFEACTKVVEYHSHGTPYGHLCLIDTPGMAEENNQRDLAYLRLVRREVDLRRPDAVLFVSRLDETRLRPQENEAILNISTILGQSIWSPTQLILTFAANVPPEDRDERCRRRGDALSRRIHQTAPYSVGVFARTWMVDNVVGDWTPNGQPIARGLLAPDPTV